MIQFIMKKVGVQKKTIKYFATYNEVSNARWRLISLTGIIFFAFLGVRYVLTFRLWVEGMDECSLRNGE